MDLQAFDVSLV